MKAATGKILKCLVSLLLASNFVAPALASTQTHNPDGSRDTLSTPAGDWEYLYDIGGRTTSLVSPAGTHTIDYADNNWIEKRTLPNGTYTNYVYNEIGLPESVTNKSSGGTTQTSFGSFSYDGVFNMLVMTATYASADGNFGPSGFQLAIRLIQLIRPKLGGPHEDKETCRHELKRMGSRVDI